MPPDHEFLAQLRAAAEAGARARQQMCLADAARSLTKSRKGREALLAVSAFLATAGGEFSRWTREDVQQLLDAWADGHTADAVAAIAKARLEASL